MLVCMMGVETEVDVPVTEQNRMGDAIALPDQIVVCNERARGLLADSLPT